MFDFLVLLDELGLLKRILLLTGMPRIGKTTVLTRFVDILRAQGISVGGMISQELLSSGVRVGFEILDLTSGRHGCLASINQKSGPRIGKYRVCMEDLDRIGVESISGAIQKSKVIVIDEIGPMELFSERFKQVIKQALDSNKPVLAVVHYKAKDPLITLAKQRDDSEIITVTSTNRDKLHQELAKKFIFRD